MRKVGAVLIGLFMIAAVGVAYNQCSQQCPSPCPGSCETCVSAQQSSSCGDCSARMACMKRDKCDKCPVKGAKSVDKLTGTVRYVRSTNKAVKIVTGDEGKLLRIHRKCPLQSVLMKKLSALEKGDAVDACYWTCAESGKYYLVQIVPEGESTAPKDEGTG